MIMNPPSAWAVAKRDAPQGPRSKCWTHGFPVGPKGPLCTVSFRISGAYGISPRNKEAAKERAVASVATGLRSRKTGGGKAAAYDFNRRFEKLTTLEKNMGRGRTRRRGTLYHYPNPQQ